MKWAIRLGLVFVATALFAWGVAAFTGPRMKTQISIKTGESVMPPLPEGVVSVERPNWPAPTTQQAAGMRNPLERTAANIAAGRVYYGYYCAFCHGGQGTGNGEVGESYVPTPANLHDGRLDKYSDAQLLRRMLTGDSHAPQMERVVHPEHRWYLVLYLRELAASPMSAEARQIELQQWRQGAGKAETQA